MATKFSTTEKKELLATLENRFHKNPQRHKGISWEKVAEALQSNTQALQTLHLMEQSGGEPDVIAFDKKNGNYLFVDCAAESPKERRSLCYDDKALQSRKEHKPKSSAEKEVAAMGAELLTEEMYFQLQQLGDFDLKTSTWLATPAEVRKLGGAIFGDKRYGRTFIYHNGAESYYGSRGFRTYLWV